MKKISLAFATLLAFFALGTTAQAQSTNCEIKFNVKPYASYYMTWEGAALDIYQGTTKRGSVSLEFGDVESASDIMTVTIPIYAGSDADDVYCILNLDDYDGYGTYACFTCFDGQENEVYTTGSSYYYMYNSYDGDTVFSFTPSACATCKTPSITSHSHTASTATFSWKANNGETQFVYSIDEGATWTLTSETTATISDLTAATSYTFVVAAYCGGSDTSNIATYTFTTSYASITSLSELPWVEDFDYALNSYVYGVDEFKTHPIVRTNNNYFPAKATYSYCPGFGYVYCNGAYGLNVNTYYEDCYFGTVNIEVPISDVEVRLAYGGKSPLVVGYSTPPDDTSTFVAVDTIVPTTTLTNYLVTFENESYTGISQIVFYYPHDPNFTYSYTYYGNMIDDIVIRPYHPCPQYMGTISMVSKPEHGEVTLTWDEQDGVSQWEVTACPQGGSVYDADAISKVFYEVPATFDGLEDNVVYDFYIRTYCGGSDTAYLSDAFVTAATNTYLMNNSVPDTMTTCDLRLMDDGGFGDQPAIKENHILVLRNGDPDSAVQIRGWIEFYTTTSTYSTFTVYDGENTDGEILFQWKSGSVNDTTITSKQGPMTIVYYNYGYSYYSSLGFDFQVSCTERSTCFEALDFEVEVDGAAAAFSWGYPQVEEVPEGFKLNVYDAETDANVYTTTVDGDARTAYVSGLDQRVAYYATLQTICPNEVPTDTVRFNTGCVNGGDIFVGNSNTTYTSSSYPILGGNSNGLAQTIYTADDFGSDLNVGDTIFGLRFDLYSLGYTPGSYQTFTGEYEIYLVNSDATEYAYSGYSSFKDRYIYPTDGDLVFSGEYTFVYGGLNELYFTTPVVYTGESLVLTCRTVTGSYSGNPYIRYAPANSCRVFYCTSAYSAVDSLTTSYTYGYNNLPNMTFLVPCGDPNCVTPSKLVAEPTHDQVSLSWNGNDGDTWQISYREQGDPDWIVAGTTSVSNHTISGLTPGTKYEVMVSTVCESGNASKKIEFVTDCHALPVPYYQGFEKLVLSSSAGNVTLCWDRFNANGGTASYPYTTASYPYEGTYSLYFSSYYETFLALPEFDEEMTNTEIFFQARTSVTTDTGSADVLVGVLEGSLNGYNVVPVDTIRVSNQYDGYYVDFDEYTGTGTRIVLRALRNSVYMDNLEVVSIPTCDRMHAATVSDVTENSLVLTIDDPNNRTNYVVYYNTTDNQSSAQKTTLTADAKKQVTLTGLTAGTTYYIWVAASCSAGNESPVVRVGAVATFCNVINVTNTQDYTNDVEGDATECLRINSNGGTIYWTIADVANGSGKIYDGDRSLLCDDGGSAGFSGYSTLLLPAMNFSGLTESDAELSFQHYSTVSTYSYMNHTDRVVTIMYRTSYTGTWNEITTIDSTSYGSWFHRYIDLPNSKGAAFYQVGIRVQNTMEEASYASYHSEHYIDDIRVGTKTECRPLLDYEITNVTEHQAVVKWANDGKSTHRVQYRIKGAFNWSGIVVEDADSAVIVPLVSGKTYNVRIATICGENSVSEYSSIKSFTAATCENFDLAYNYTTTVAPDTTADVIIKSGTAYSYTEVLLTADALGTLGTVDGAATINSMTLEQLSDVTYNYAVGNNAITILMRHTDAATLDSLFHYDADESVQVYSGTYLLGKAGKVELTFDTPFEWNGTDNIIVSFYTSGSYWSAGSDGALKHASHAESEGSRLTYYNSSKFLVKETTKIKAKSIIHSTAVPNITLKSCSPQCFEPTLRHITTTATSITVQWVNEGGTVEVAIKAKEDSGWDNVKTVTGDYKTTFDMLMPNTEYEVRLRRDCSSTGASKSGWVTTSIITDTACTIPEAIVISDVNSTTATIDWTGDAVANTWEINVYNAGWDTVYTTTSHPYVMTNLRPGAYYTVKVRAYCGKSDKIIGEWSETANFQNTCGAVTGLTASAISTTDVKVEWAAGNRNEKWQVSWTIKGDDINEQIGYAEVSTNTYTIKDLKTGKSYSIYVRGICDDGWNSAWSNAINVNLNEGEGINDVDGGNARFSLQPNPATDRVTLSLDSYEGTANVTILSVDGREVSSFSTNENTYTVSLKDYASGTYFVRVQTDEWTGVHKLIVK